MMCTHAHLLLCVLAIRIHQIKPSWERFQIQWILRISHVIIIYFSRELLDTVVNNFCPSTMLLRNSCVVAALASVSVANCFTAVPASRGVRLISGSSSSSSLHVATEPKKDLFVDATATQSSVQDYYGKELQNSDDLKTNACCAAVAPPDYIKEAIDNIHPDVKKKYYGCGLCLPQYDMTGLRVLNLGWYVLVC